MNTAIWTVLSVSAMVGLFVACVIAVVAGVRVLESLLARRRDRPQA